MADQAKNEQLNSELNIVFRYLVKKDFRTQMLKMQCKKQHINTLDFPIPFVPPKYEAG